MDFSVQLSIKKKSLPKSHSHQNFKTPCSEGLTANKVENIVNTIMKTKLNHNYNRTGLAVLLSNCNIDKCNQTISLQRQRN